MKKLIRTLEEANKYNAILGDVIDLPDPVRKGKKKEKKEEEIEVNK